MKRLAIITAAVVGLAACGGSATSDEPRMEDEVNWTEADFAQDFAVLSYDEQQEVCGWFWSVSEEEFDQELWDQGYVESQIISSWNVLVEVCP